MFRLSAAGSPPAAAVRLLDDVRIGEERAERLYGQAQEILNRALLDKDPRTALQAIRVAVDAMREAKAYLVLRGELTGQLGRDRKEAAMSIQIVLPGADDGPAALPRVSYAEPDQIDNDCIEIGLVQQG